MKYTVDKLEKKSPDWYLASLSDENTNSYHEVSINKKNKKGEEFPNFDAIEEGVIVHGEFWNSPSGKNYLFPPKLEKKGGGNMAGMMAKKEQSIATAQHRKEESIAKAQDRSAWMWAKTNASSLLATRGGIQGWSQEDIALEVIELATKIYNGEPITPF